MTHFFRRKFLTSLFAASLAVSCLARPALAVEKTTKATAAKTKAKAKPKLKAKAKPDPKASKTAKAAKGSKTAQAKTPAKEAGPAQEAPATAAAPAQPRDSASAPAEEGPLLGPARSTDAAEGATFGDVHYKYKLNTGLGVHILIGTGWLLGVGAQMGFAPFAGRPFYVGPELALALGSPGYMVDTLLGAWYEVRVAGAPRLSLSAGLLAGATISSGVPGMNSVGATALLDIALAQDINELVTIRGQIRPGVVGRYGAVLINFNVQFRFE